MNDSVTLWKKDCASQRHVLGALKKEGRPVWLERMRVGGKVGQVGTGVDPAQGSGSQSCLALGAMERFRISLSTCEVMGRFLSRGKISSAMNF